VTTDQAAALSLLEHLPRRDLTARLMADDPELLERAAPVVETAARARRSAEARGIRFLPWNDPSYPAALLAIPDGPPGLWIRGDTSAFAVAAVAVVGSRSGSPTALEAATRLAEDLAAAGIVVVSGLARGVDSAAHRGALRSGRTIAVLGSGLDRVYPGEHAGLAAEIARSGAVISEYPPDTPALPFHFPLRNRIISGLSRAVVVVEAAEESGSLITAACALEQGRDVMAVPGNVLTGRNRGGHALIRDGARIVERATDVLSELGLIANQAVHRAPSDSRKEGSGDPLLRAMDLGQAYDLDALAMLAGVDAARLLPRVSALELAGWLRRAPGGRFMRTS
jgi:DNA processing protein